MYYQKGGTEQRRIMPVIIILEILHFGTISYARRR